MPSRHVAIVSSQIADRLLSGEKTIESRLYRSRRPPFGTIAAGDTIYFRAVGGPIFARSIAQRVEQHADLTPAEVVELRRAWAREVAAQPGYWRAKRHSRFAVLIWLDHVRPTRRSRTIVARQYGSAWVTLP